MSEQAKPITLGEFSTAVGELPDDTLVSVKNQLENSLAKLSQTNDQLHSEITNLQAGDSDNPDIEMYEDIIAENKQVIASQKDRVDIIDKELVRRGFSLKEPEPEIAEPVKDEGVYL